MFATLKFIVSFNIKVELIYIFTVQFWCVTVTIFQVFIEFVVDETLSFHHDHAIYIFGFVDTLLSLIAIQNCADDVQVFQRLIIWLFIQDCDCEFQILLIQTLNVKFFVQLNGKLQYNFLVLLFHKYTQLTPAYVQNTAQLFVRFLLFQLLSWIVVDDVNG